MVEGYCFWLSVGGGAGDRLCKSDSCYRCKSALGVVVVVVIVVMIIEVTPPPHSTPHILSTTI